MSQEATTTQRPVATAEDILQRAAIDRTTRLPVLFLYTSAAVWLLIATVLGLLASIQFYAPEFINAEWANFGRTQPAFINALVYGWAFQAGLGTMVWIMARLCRTPLKNPLTLVVAGHFWNLGVTIGVAGILTGHGTAAKMLEFPAAAWPILLIAYVLITIWLVIMFVARRQSDVYISQWYLLAACFSFPWSYITANLVVNTFGKGGMMGPATASWYSGNLLFLWMVPVGLASAYYIIPKVVGKAIHSYQLAIGAFWSLLALGGWTGLQDLIGGPLPTWMPALSGGAQVLMLLPVIAVGVNHFHTVRGSHDLLGRSPALRFTFFSSVGYCVACVTMALVATSSLGRYAQFTLAGDAGTFACVYMFFTMAMFGAIYFIVPRVTGCEWISGAKISRHFMLSAYGSVFVVGCNFVGGLFSGSAADSWEHDMEGSVSLAKAFEVGVTLGWLMLTVANLGFFSHLAGMVLNKGRKSTDPTLFPGHDKYDHSDVVITTEGAEPA
jgi:cytochrome c oxidase cbb3-type subunit I